MWRTSLQMRVVTSVMMVSVLVLKPVTASVETALGLCQTCTKPPFQ